MDGMIVAAVVSILSATMRMSTPIALGAIGEVMSERTGIVNMGIEGQMLMGAFAAVVGTYFGGNNPFVGLLLAVAVGGISGLLHAFFVIRLRANQIVVGVGMNILAVGLTAVGLQAIWGNRGRSGYVAGLPRIELGPLAKIPILGPILDQQSVIVWMLPIIAVVCWFVLFRTTLGLRMRVAGENPEAADAVGIRLAPLQYFAVVVGGALSGLGGAYLSLSDMTLFGYSMVSGRGFIALTATIVGNWHPGLAVVASLVFGFLGAVQIRLQGSAEIPKQFVQMIPYLLAIVLVSARMGRMRAPARVGQIYERGS